MHPLDRPLLLGLVALEQELVTPAELIDAFRQWRQQPESSLGRILASKGKLSAERIASLEQFVADSSLAGDAGGTQIFPNSQTTAWNPDTTSLATDNEPTTSRHESPDYATAFRTRAPVARRDAPIRFRPVRLHARGGLGQVFLAEDLELHRRVALKEIKTDAADDAASRHRFVVEAEITGNLEHPGIVPVYGLGVYPDGRPFYAMRFIEGETLSAAIAKFHQAGKPDFSSLEFRQLLSRLVSVCNAVAFAHSRDILHRDLKPQNVMLGPFGETLVVDWGLAKSLRTSFTVDGSAHATGVQIENADAWATSAGEMVGTPSYMSPEQARGQIDKLGPASDVYSLGATLYSLLAGQSPHHSDATDVVQRIREGRFTPPRTQQPLAPRPLAAICMKAMAPAISDRYLSALELAADLERWLADEPATAYTEPWTDKAFRWVRKNRLPVAVATALLLVISISLAIGYTLVRKERDIARQERASAVAANDRAQQNAAHTREVVEQFLIQVGDDRWSEIPRFEEVRIEMANLAVERYRDLIAQQPKDAELSADAAEAFRRCANLFRMVGRHSTAKSRYDDAINLLQPLSAAHQSEPRYQLRLCETQIDRALLIWRADGPQAAESSLRAALSVATRLRGREPSSLAMRYLEARAQSNLSDIVRDLGQYDEAHTLAKSAAETMRRSFEGKEGSSANQLSALLATMNLGQAMADLGRQSEAAATLDSVLARAQRFLAERPQDANLPFIVASCRLERARVAIAQNESGQAIEDAISQAVHELEQLATDFPNTASRRRRLAEALTAQAHFERDRANYSAATTAAARAVDLLEQLDREENSPAVYQPLLGAAYAVAGEIETARGDAPAARLKLLEAQRRFERASESNPESRKLRDQIHQTRELLATLGC